MLSLLSLAAQPSTSNFKRISADLGLSHQQVLSTFQDRHGYIWITTESGIDRFDGYKFESLQFILPDDVNPDGYTCIYETKEGELWVGTEQAGILVFDQDKNLVDHFFHNPYDIKSLSNNWVFPIIEDANGQIWVATYGGGLNKFDPESRSFIRFQHDPEDPMSLSEDRLYSIEEDKAGHLWIGTESTGLNQFDPKSGKVLRNYRQDPNDPGSIGSNSVYGVEVDFQDRVWIFSYGFGVSLLDRVSGKFSHFVPDSEDPRSLPSSNLNTLLEKPGKGLWIGTQDVGLCFLDFNSLQFTTYSHSPNQLSSLSSNIIKSLFIDREENLWVGTTNGPNIYHPLANQFVNFQHDPANINSIRTNAISALYEDSRGLIWIGTLSEGLSYYDKSIEKFKHFKQGDKNASGFSGLNVLSITEDASGNILVGTKYGGLNIYNRSTEKFTQLPYSSNSGKGLINEWVFDLEIDNTGAYWIAHPSGLSRYDPKNQTYQHYSSRSSDDIYIESQFINQLFLDTEEMLWAFDATNNNWFRINPKDPENAQSIDLNFSPLYLEDNSDILWIESNKGLISYRFSTGEKKKYSEANGLPPGHINSMLKDKVGNYWLGTNRGLFHWKIKEKTSKLYNKNDGLITNSFAASSAIQSEDNSWIYFSSNDGISSFNPDGLLYNPHIPPITISSLSYIDSRSDNSKAINIKGIEILENISFPHYCNILSIEFSALSYSKTEKNKYAYQLEGLSNTWIDLGNQRGLTLTNLDPKTYVLRVKGSNGDGVWNEEGVTLNIKITPPWWSTWWAYIVYFGIFGSLIWLYTRWKNKVHIQRLEEERKVVERLKQIDKIKDQFLANTSHELRTPLNGIIGLSDSLLDGVAGPLTLGLKKNLSMISNSGRRLAHLVNDILDFSKLKNKGLKLNTQPLDLYSTLEVVLAMSETLIQEDSVDIINNVSRDIPLVQGDENRIQQILFNLIGNAIKFTKQGSITIDAICKNEFIQTTITDTGIGIPKAKMKSIFKSFEQVDGDSTRVYGGTGLGLSITQLLLEQHGGKIFLESEEGLGTKVSFTLPCSSVDRAQHISNFNSPKPVSTIYHDTLEGPTAQIAPPLEKLNGHVLVVDDEGINRQVLQNHLSLGGYEVTAVIDGMSALSLFEKGNIFDLVLLDIMMPRMSGYEVAQEIRKSYPASELPIIMLTAKNRVDDLITGFNAGANDYLTKPFIKSELLARVKTHIHLRSIHIATKQFVPDEFIRTIGRNDITDVELGDHAEKIVTVLFTDIRDYTAISEEMSPTDNFNFVSSYVSKMGPIIERNNGFINQYLGDGIMAIFPHKPSDALTAAIEMQHGIRAFNSHRINRNRKPIRVGMGMMTGPLVMGIIGHKHRKDTTSISDTVNVASRLEGLTKTYGASIMLSRETVRAITHADRFNIRNLGRASVKGKSSKLNIYECFDGYPPDQFTLIEEKSELFHRAIDYFMNRSFDDALKDFELLEKAIPSDRVVQFFVDKCRAQLASQALQKSLVKDNS